jgi:hypothetical protein
MPSSEQVEKWPVPSSKQLDVDAQESHFQATKCSRMVCAVLQAGRFVDAQESRFQDAIRSVMTSAVLQTGRFVDAQDSRFQVFRKWVGGGMDWIVPPQIRDR